MPTEFEECCEKCKFWKSSSDYIGKGDCRRYPPTVLSKNSYGAPLVAFPATEKNGWCGEFQYKEKLANWIKS